MEVKFFRIIFYVLLWLMKYGLAIPINYNVDIAVDKDALRTTKFEYKHSEVEREFWGKLLDDNKKPGKNDTVDADEQEAFLVDVIAVFAMASLCLITLWVVVLYAYGYQCQTSSSTRHLEKDTPIKEKYSPYRSTAPLYRSVNSSNRSLLKNSPDIQRNSIRIIEKSDSAGSLVAL